MKSPKVFSDVSNGAKIVFFISLLIFLLSLVPISYGAGYTNGLSGSAGIGSGPNEPPDMPTTLLMVNYYITVISGVIGSLSLLGVAFANAGKARFERNSEEIKYKTSKLQYEMQMKEIEKLRLELELEKRENKKRRK